MFDFLKKNELSKIKRLEERVIELEELLESDRKMYEQQLAKRSTVKCKNVKCMDNEDGRCMLKVVVIKPNAVCEDFGEDDQDLEEDLKHNLNANVIKVR